MSWSACVAVTCSSPVRTDTGQCTRRSRSPNRNGRIWSSSPPEPWWCERFWPTRPSGCGTGTRAEKVSGSGTVGMAGNDTDCGLPPERTEGSAHGEDRGSEGTPAPARAAADHLQGPRLVSGEGGRGGAVPRGELGVGSRQQREAGLLDSRAGRDRGDPPGRLSLPQQGVAQSRDDGRCDPGPDDSRPQPDDEQRGPDHQGVGPTEQHADAGQQQAEEERPDVGRGHAPARLQPAPGGGGHGRSKPVRGPAPVAVGVGTDDSTLSTTLAAETSFIHSSGRTVTRWSRAACATALTSSGVT